MWFNNKKEVLERQEIVKELDKLLDSNENNAQNLEAINDLQSKLHSIMLKPIKTT